MNTKIQEHHKNRLAYIYLRQSTMGQVRFNQESTERQYALQNKADQLGWQPHLVKVLDRDLGISGSQVTNRDDFKTLVADVSMGKVGAVFALEASRFSRSCTDWHRLLELCAMTHTLIIDEDGYYDPTDFNDQLLLGLKGTMSQAELHFIRARLLGGKLNKAKKGELRSPLPVGYCHDTEGRIVLDEDEQVRNVVTLLFKTFREVGTAYKVVHYFYHNHIKFPKRAYGGVWGGKLEWSNLNYTRVLGVLKNPCYAGMYVFGRYKCNKHFSGEGNIKNKIIKLPMEDWKFTIKDHHEGYISWEEYLENQKQLRNNQTNLEENLLPGPAREGQALLQGLLICGHCGHRITIRYIGNGGVYPYYRCNIRKEDGTTKFCLWVHSSLIDQAIVRRVLEIIKPSQIEIAIKAFEEVEQRKQTIEKQWEMKITRAEYESQLAQRRYEEVDPANRLVASTLEKRWNETLLGLESIKEQYNEYQKKTSMQETTKHKNNILSIAKDFPKLWNAKSTTCSDRKRILRLLIKDITVKKFKDSGEVSINIRWHGGALESITIALPAKAHSESIINEVKLLAQKLTDEQIAIELNQRGLKTNKGNTFTVTRIRWIRSKHNIPTSCLRRPGEFTTREVMKKFDVSYHVVYSWIERGIVQVQQVDNSKILWIIMDQVKERELQQLVNNSTQIAKVKTMKSQNQIAAGAV
jgi:DNA invertase Pin-like site-specific DNA recombinase